MDGTPTLRMNEFVLASLDFHKVDLGPSIISDPSSLPPITELIFDIDAKVLSLIQQSAERFDNLVGAHDLHVLHYEGFGKDFTKKHKVSPDATVQLIKQLAFHKFMGRPGVTYESAQTRKFQLGRTEVIRSASNESRAWVEAMLDPTIKVCTFAFLIGFLPYFFVLYKDPVHLRSLFARAVARHIQYATWAADGQGVDRHLFGLKKLLKEGEPLPEIYKDPAFARSSHWEVSTSQLSSPFFDGWGYGEGKCFGHSIMHKIAHIFTFLVVPDGYGLSYSIGNDHIRWTITSLKRRTEVLKHYIAEAATEVKNMLEAAEKKEKSDGVVNRTEVKTKL